MNEPFLTPEDIADIVAILDGSDYRELDVATARFRLTLRREGGGEAGGRWSQEWQWAAANGPAAAVAAVIQDTPAGLVAVAAPLPGAFYRAPAPGAPPFVEIGAHVDGDTVVGIVETMKLMNPVHAGHAGEVVAIVAENGAMVEGGATLMHIRPHA